MVRLDSPGARLLMKAADRQTLTDLRVQGTALRDQALMVDGLLEAGHSPWTIHEVIALPMPDPVKTSRSAVISGRLKKLAGTAPVALPSMSAGAPQETPVPGPRWEDSPTPTAPNWTDRKAEQEQLRHGVELNPGCAGDGGLCPVLAVVGETLCPTHLGWPLCPGHDGRTCTTRTRTGEQCATCSHDAFYARLDAELPVIETEDGTCPGYDGPCGRGVVMMGLCPRCRMASQADRDRIEAEFDAARAAAVASIAADEGHTGEQEQHAERKAEECRPQEEAEGHRAAALAVELDEEAAHREAVERAERAEQDRERAARERSADEETARLRAELAAQFPDLAAVSGSVREAQEAQQPALSPF
ncbi:hypothetical protein OG728_00530 [Streptomyces microflavus]|uniref:hypothetical protein n=1 Tax=Streptomyces microflavus TaxID=1919 RepID=UPI002E12E3EF|nr:hypothetical protein OG728_00530 [Streptomyces microflavus]